MKSSLQKVLGNSDPVKNRIKKVLPEVLFLLAVFVFLFLWAKKAPFDASPDESMRFQVADYIRKHGTLPDGRDPELRNANWGISYAFNPITTMILCAVFGRVVRLFTDSFQALYLSMRLVNVLFGTLTAYLALRIGKRLFDGAAAWFFAVMVSFLPGAVFLHSYINMDSIALFSTAWIILCWVQAVQDGWSIPLCIRLSAAMAVCALSYYNAYGFLLCSALLFAGMMLRCGVRQWNYSEMFRKGFLILGVTALFAGWWFLRNGRLYDGDILGMRTSTQYSQLYAIEELKPSNRETPARLGMSVMDMFFLQPGTWKYNWISTVAASFIGTFGHMDLFMPELWTKCYIVVLLAGLLGNLLQLRRDFSLTTQLIARKEQADGQGKQIIKIYRKSVRWSSENFFRLCLLLSAAIPPVLLVYYSYYSDFQAQGRYIMPVLFPLMYFVTRGYDNILKKIIKNDRIRSGCFLFGAAAAVLSSVLVYQLVYAASY